jgi:ABC-type polysaccharide/polyol phosphate export permease
MRFIYDVLILAQRDLLKFIRDRGRIAATFVFPIIFIGVFGVTLDSGLGRVNLGFNYIDYVFSGILLQTIFQSSFSGIVSLIADREKDFAMSIFVSPV